MKTLFTLSCLITLFFSASARDRYPQTKMEDSTDSYFGGKEHSEIVKPDFLIVNVAAVEKLLTLNSYT